MPAVSQWMLRAHLTTLPRGEGTSEQAPTQRGSTVGRSQAAQHAAEQPPPCVHVAPAVLGRAPEGDYCGCLRC